MSLSIIIAIVGIPICVGIYVLLYRWRLNLAMKRYQVASAAGKRPLLVLGGVWFSFYEDYDPKHYPPNLEFVSAFASGGRVAGVLYQLKWPGDD